MSYINYTYFSGNGGSSEITESAFSPLEYRAEKVIDRATQKRVQSMTTVPDAVKRLMVELVNIENKGGSKAITSPALASASNDGYSETYADPVTADTIAKVEAELVRQYLSGEVDDNNVPLLFLGVV